MRHARARNWLPGLLLVAPSIILVAIFVYGLIGWNFKVALSDEHHSYDPGKFVGTENFSKIWDIQVWSSSVKNGLVFTAVFVGGALVLGFFLAFLMDKAIKGEGSFRAVYLFPMAVSFVATGVVWKWLMASPHDKNASGLNRLFIDLGLGSLQNDWYNSTTWTNMASLALPAIWQMSGYIMALFLAGFRGVPDDLREAARVDGANEWKVYRYVVLPALRPVLLTAIIILGHISLKIFDLVYSINGKSVNTEVPAIFMWQRVYDRGDAANGATAGAYILLAVAVFVIPYLIWFVRSEKKR
ncbi:sugar ABC transporter permease [Catenulispora subtropica]|uniref:Sugar ABC transporter permease n=1 Tax=Catenulispora subtropica TaxID=450798 RepID=A0ABN2T371_9ACTN